MPTERLYYADAYQHQFQASVLATRPGFVALDRTAFYPEGGGQPADHGWLNEVAVSDVQIDARGTIWHQVSTDIPVGTTVSGRIDWQRRFDHMQQHSGQHVLSQAFWQLYQAATVGFHLGEQVVTIDLDKADLSEAQLEQAEELANAVIRSRRPLVARFVAKADLPLEELRKLPQVTEDIRLVAVTDFDICPCGGTHVRDLGEVGLLKLLASEKRRGNLRLSFVAGRRAYADYQEKQHLLQQLSALLSVPPLAVGAGVIRLTEKIALLEKQVKQLQADLLGREAERLQSRASQIGDVALVLAQYDQSFTPDQLKHLITNLIAAEQTVVLLAAVGDDYRLLLGISPGGALHAGRLLQSVLDSYGGKGGGSPQLAQGMVPAQSGQLAFTALEQLIRAELG